MRSFENRLALGEVLDDVHRQTVASALASVGIMLAGESWNEIQDAVDEQKILPFPSGTYLDKLEYIGDDPTEIGGTTSAGTLFGEEYVLARSGRAPSFSESDRVGLGDDKYRRRIELFAASNNTFPDFTSVYLIPDAPPIAVYANSLIELHTDAWNKGKIIPETEIIEKIQKGVGSKGVEYIGEEMAKRVIQALRTDQRRLYNTDQFHFGE